MIAAEVAYARKIGLRLSAPPLADRAAVEAFRGAIAAVIGTGREAGGGWPVRYAARRFAWHALDHAWEIKDRAAG